MTITGIGQPQAALIRPGQGAQAYRRVSRQTRTEPLPEVVSKARVRSKSFGFSLGGFGLDYSAKDLEFDLAAMVRAAREELRDSGPLGSFRDEMDVAQAAYGAGSGVGGDADNGSARAEGPACSPRRCAAAYADVQAMTDETSRPGRGLGSA